MTKKPRGGKRPGAGRPLALSDAEKLRVGALIHQRVVKTTQTAFNSSIAKRHSDDGIEELWRRINSIPVPVRQQRRKEWEENHPGEVYDAKLDESEIGSLLDEIQGAIEEGSLKGRRYFMAPERATKGGREQAIRVVVRACRRCGISLTERMAKTCFDKYRAYVRDAH